MTWQWVTLILGCLLHGDLRAFVKVQEKRAEQIGRLAVNHLAGRADS